MQIRVNDVGLFFEVEGTKFVPDGPLMKERPTVLLLHGGPGMDHTAFRPDFSPLADAAQLIYLDHRGHGRSGRSSPDKWNLAQWADDMHAFCNALHLEKPVVLGLSFGGMVAQAYALRYPDHPGKLVLLSTAAQVRLDRSYEAFERAGGPQARRAAEDFWTNPDEHRLQEYLSICMPLYTQRGDDPDRIKRTILRAEVLFRFAGAQGEFTRFNFLPELRRIRCPTLVMAGDKDPITTMADAEDMAAALPSELVRFERFPGCGHGVHRDDPARAFTVLRKFLAS